jgi:hypothetical protein
MGFFLSNSASALLTLGCVDRHLLQPAKRVVGDRRLLISRYCLPSFSGELSGSAANIMLLDRSNCGPTEALPARLALDGFLSGKQAPIAATQTDGWKIRSGSKYEHLPTLAMLRNLQT